LHSLSKNDVLPFSLNFYLIFIDPYLIKCYKSLEAMCPFPSLSILVKAEYGSNSLSEASIYLYCSIIISSSAIVNSISPSFDFVILDNSWKYGFYCSFIWFLTKLLFLLLPDLWADEDDFLEYDFLFDDICRIKF